MKNSEKWERMYSLAVAYYNYYGNLKIPTTFKTDNGINFNESGLKLGRWLNRQKQIQSGKTLGYLDKERIEKLEKIGMVWDDICLVKNQDNWEYMYNLAYTYYNYYGNLNIKENFKTKDGINFKKDGYRLDIWVAKQKNMIRNIDSFDDERIFKLGLIGIKWESLYDDKWMKMFNLASAYYNHYGNLLVRDDFKTNDGINFKEDGINLGHWISNQRRIIKKSNDKLYKERIDKLNSIGMIWNIYDVKWMRMFNLASAYYNYYGNLFIPKNFKTNDGINFKEDGVKLGIWIMYQRQSRRGNTESVMSDYRISKLDSIGMIWDDIRLTENQDNWDLMFSLASAYYNYYGNLKVKNNFKTNDGINFKEDGLPLGDWILNQKTSLVSKQDNSIIRLRINKLNSIGMIWDNYNDKKWDEMYELASKYYNYYHNLRVKFNFKTKDGISYSEDGYKLGAWLQNQKNLKNSDKKNLKDDRIVKLNSIGMIWDYKEESWNYGYLLASMYYNHYGNLLVPKGFKTINGVDNVKDDDAFNLGQWIAVQRCAMSGISSATLTEEKINKLNSIGMVWEVRKNKEKLLELLLEYNIDVNKNKNILNRSYREVYCKICFLEDNSISITKYGILNKIFFTSDLKMQEEYNVSLESLIKKYIPNEEYNANCRLRNKKRG